MCGEKALALTDGEAAKLLGVSVMTVRRMRWEGQLPTIKVGSRGVRIPRQAVEELARGEYLSRSEDEDG